MGVVTWLEEGANIPTTTANTNKTVKRTGSIREVDHLVSSSILQGTRQMAVNSSTCHISKHF